MKPVSGKRMCRILEDNGWVLVRIKSSHYIYRFSGQPQLIVVPVHKNKDLKTGTQHFIMRDAELEERDL
jgi:predicted RNA binding protein YcfA (HicA-like mRNA interferase family)